MSESGDIVLIDNLLGMRLPAHGSATVTRLTPELRLYPGGPFSLWCLHAQLGTRLPAFVLNHCYGDVCIEFRWPCGEGYTPCMVASTILQWRSGLAHSMDGRAGSGNRVRALEENGII